jgi:hypothetical protein
LVLGPALLLACGADAGADVSWMGHNGSLGQFG